MEPDISQLVSENFNVVIMGAIGFWVKSMLSDIKKIDKIEDRLKELAEKIDAQSGELKSMTNLIYQNQKDLAVQEQSLKAQWRKTDELSNQIREMKL